MADSDTTPVKPVASRGRRIAKRVVIGLAVVLVYGASLLAYHLLAQTSRPLPPPDLGTSSDTVVVVDLESLDTTDNELNVKVLVVPDDSLMDTNLDVLKTDIAVGLYPANEAGDLIYPAGRQPSLISTSVAAHGNSHNWPFDTYTTPELFAGLLTGTGADRQGMPARVEVSGSLEGWDVSIRRSGESSQSTDDGGDKVTITLRRAKGALVFDLGICLVLISLPVVALFVVISIIRGKTLQPAFGTWFAALLFAVVPIRNILPGNPPYGSWIDQAVVLWVLIALVSAMTLFFVTWYRKSD